MSFDPNPQATNTFNNMFGRAEVSPVGNAGYSHFGYIQPLNVNVNHNQGWHVTTQVPGLNQGPYNRIHNNLSDMNLR